MTANEVKSVTAHEVINKNKDMIESKQEFRELVLKLMEPLKEYYTKGRAGLDLGSTGSAYPQKTILMEAFSRPLWGVVPYWAGGGSEEEFAAIYREGIVNGTDPGHPEYWGGFHNCDQKYVEMAALAYAMLFAADVVWEPLSWEAKSRMAEWLNGINQNEVADNNWQFFKILVNVALKKRGMVYSPEKLEQCLLRVEDFYLGDGWYQDGLTAQKDYYISFAILFYSMIYVAAMEKEDPERCGRYRERAGLFAEQFIYWFSKEGESLPYGRSLTYRFAQTAFWSMAAVIGIDTIPLPVMKGIIVRHIDYWMRQPIFDKKGILTIGYAYPCLHMAESYNAPGSPYWSMKAFAFLMLPDDHAFWKVKAAPLPPLKSLKTLAFGEMVIQRRPGDVVAYVPGVYKHNGQVHVPEKYSKFAYSTYFGFSVPRSGKLITGAVPDSMLAFEISGHIFVRRMIDSYRIEDNIVFSTWSPFTGIVVETILVPTQNGHIRKHKIESDIDCIAYDCGFAVSARLPGLAGEVFAHSAYLKNSECICRVTSLKKNGEGIKIWGAPNTNLLTQNTEIPAVKYTIVRGITEIETEVETEVYE